LMRAVEENEGHRTASNALLLLGTESHMLPIVKPPSAALTTAELTPSVAVAAAAMMPSQSLSNIIKKSNHIRYHGMLFFHTRIC